ncbi:MAG: RidA family protein [Octadecabacter sp.]|nr:RidA family protein [Octadecabacter sp.]
MTTDITRSNGNGRMSQIVEHGGILYLSGQVGNPQTSVVEQTLEVLGKVDALLQAAGTDKSRILSATIWLADMTDFQAMNAVWDDWVIDGQEPARACGEAKLAHADMRVEIMIIAAKA